MLFLLSPEQWVILNFQHSVHFGHVSSRRNGTRVSSDVGESVSCPPSGEKMSMPEVGKAADVFVPRVVPFNVNYETASVSCFFFLFFFSHDPLGQLRFCMCNSSPKLNCRCVIASALVAYSFNSPSSLTGSDDELQRETHTHKPFSLKYNHSFFVPCLVFCL